MHLPGVPPRLLLHVPPWLHTPQLRALKHAPHLSGCQPPAASTCSCISCCAGLQHVLTSPAMYCPLKLLPTICCPSTRTRTTGCHPQCNCPCVCMLLPLLLLQHPHAAAMLTAFAHTCCCHAYRSCTHMLLQLPLLQHPHAAATATALAPTCCCHAYSS